jgi:hypothetical protein
MAAAPGVERKHLQDDQRSWEEDSGGCWDRIDCIKKRYSDRIASLLGYIGHLITASVLKPPNAPPTTSNDPRFAQAAQGEASQAIPPSVDGETLTALPPESSPTNPTPPTTASNVAQQSTTGTDDHQQMPEPETRAEPKPQSESQNGSGIALAQQVEPPKRKSDWNWLATLGLLFIVVVPLVYLLPTIFAFSRRHRNRWIILAINLAFGATVIGWVLALVWALNKVDDPVKGGVKYDFQPNDPIL